MSVRGWLKLSHGLGTVGPTAATLMVTNTPVSRCPHVDTEVTAYTYADFPGVAWAGQLCPSDAYPYHALNHRTRIVNLQAKSIFPCVFGTAVRDSAIVVES